MSGRRKDNTVDLAAARTNCCMTNDDCGEGTMCKNCGCQCTPDNDIMNRCHTKCEEGNGEEVLIFRP